MKSRIIKSILFVLILACFIYITLNYFSKKSNTSNSFLQKIESNISLNNDNTDLLNQVSNKIIDKINNDNIHSIIELYATQENMLSILDKIQLSTSERINLEEKIRKKYKNTDDDKIKFEQAWNALRDDLSKNGIKIGSLKFITFQYESEKINHIIYFKKYNIIFEENNTLYIIKTNGAWQYENSFYLNCSKLKWDKFYPKIENEIEKIL